MNKRLIGALVLVVSMLGSCTSAPATDSSHQARDGFQSLLSNDQSYQVLWRSIPETIPLNEPFELELMIFDNRALVENPFYVQLAIDGRMPEHRHGMNVIPEVILIGGSMFRVSNMLFHMPGFWQLHFDITRRGITERAQVDVDIE